MRYEIMSRIDASLATRAVDGPATVMISITDCGDKKNTFYPAEWLTDILELQFDDVLEGGRHCITVKQAREIADFVLRVRKKAERLIVHCEFGQSRSAGVAAAISVFLEGHDHGIFSNRRYYPNHTCYDYVLKALRRNRIFLFRKPGHRLKA